VLPWEDGARTDGRAGTYEWWYFDARLDDGANLVVTFFTKNFTDIDRPLAPMIRIDLDLPDGTSHNKVAEWKPEEFSAARDHCDVRIGDNSFRGDLHSYKITAHIDDVGVTDHPRPATDGSAGTGRGRHASCRWSCSIIVSRRQGGPLERPVYRPRKADGQRG
jgi:hypothetical protein